MTRAEAAAIGNLPLALLHAALDEAREGRGRLVLIRAAAGVGKSRLTLQLEAAARSAGMQVLRGRAAASSSSVPFRPFAEALLGATRAAGPPEAPELAAYRSVLGVLIPEWSKEGPPVADRGLLLHEAKPFGAVPPAWRGAAHRRRRGGCPGSWRPA